LKSSINIFVQRYGREMMFKDCITGRYNERRFSHASPDKLIALRILIVLAMASAGLQGKITKLQGQFKYIFFLKETSITRRRPSNFWRGLYRENWLIAFDSSQEWVESMLSWVGHKKSFYQREMRAIKLIEQPP
jgi:hypothetical protein